jgi:integrase
MAASTAQNYLSAINTVMQLATLHAGVPVWKSVSPTKDAQIPQRNGIATVSRAISHQEHQCLGSAVTERIAALLNLQRSLGLRFEESAKLDARKALQQAMRENQVNISAGTKGGRSRTVPVSPEARQALEHAATIQARDRSMIPAHQTYAAFQRAAYREMINADGGGFHGERHWYAQERYQQLTGAPCPVAVGWSRSERFERLAQRLGVSPDTARQIDEIARLDIARELGHSRVGVTNAYLG